MAEPLPSMHKAGIPSPIASQRMLLGEKKFLRLPSDWDGGVFWIGKQFSHVGLLFLRDGTLNNRS